ncbi:MAG: LysR family transcriptional regulator [Vicinamibacterales bacterium]
MRETPDPRLLAAFVAVAEESSFSKAAQRLGLGKATISRAVAVLEALVGAELIHRTTHAVTLSTAGTALYERTARHLKALDHALSNLPERAEEPSGLLRLAAPHDFGVIVLPQLLSQFARRYPDVSFDLRISNRHADVVEKAFDVAIRAVVLPLKDSTLTLRRLCMPRANLYAAPSYLARRGRPRQFGAPEHDWILHTNVVSVLRLRNVRTRYLVDDFLLVRNLVRDGAGLGPMPTFVAEPYEREGLLVPVPIPPPSDRRGTYVLLYASSGQVPRKVKAFCDFAVDWLRRHPL